MGTNRHTGRKVALYALNTVVSLILGIVCAVALTVLIAVHAGLAGVGWAAIKLSLFGERWLVGRGILLVVLAVALAVGFFLLFRWLGLKIAGLVSSRRGRPKE